MLKALRTDRWQESNRGRMACWMWQNEPGWIVGKEAKRRKNNCGIARDWAQWDLLISCFPQMSPENSPRHPSLRHSFSSDWQWCGTSFLSNETLTDATLPTKNLKRPFRGIFFYSPHGGGVEMIVALFISSINFLGTLCRWLMIVAQQSIDSTRHRNREHLLRKEISTARTKRRMKQMPLKCAVLWALLTSLRNASLTIPFKLH